MESSSIKDFLGSIAVITTVLQFLSGILVCKQYVVNKTTGEASPLPFVCGVLSAALWLLYGLQKHDNNIILVNTIGFILMVSYLAVFYLCTIKKSAVIKLVLPMLATLFFVAAYVKMEEDEAILIDRLGFLASVLTLLTVGAPLSKLFYVIRVKSTECLPFPMIVMSFFVSSLWLFYGVLVEDIYLIRVNFICSALAVSQLVLFIIYPNKPHSTLLSKSSSSLI